MPPISELLSDPSIFLDETDSTEPSTDPNTVAKPELSSIQETAEQTNARLKQALDYLADDYLKFTDPHLVDQYAPEEREQLYDSLVGQNHVLIEGLQNEATCADFAYFLDMMLKVPELKRNVGQVLCDQKEWLAPQLTPLSNPNALHLATTYFNCLLEIPEDDMPGLAEVMEQTGPDIIQEIADDWHILERDQNIHHAILSRGSDGLKAQMFKVLAHHFESQSGSQRLIFGLIKSNHKVLRQQGEMLVDQSIIKHGLKPNDMTTAWKSSTSPELENNAIGNNWKGMLQLDYSEPGTAAELTRQYGIKAYRRYPLELLQQQLIEKDDHSRPHGMFITVEADDIGILYRQSGFLPQFKQDLQPSHNMRFYEAGTKRQLFSHIHSAFREYGPISFLVLNGHGLPDALILGTPFLAMDKEGNDADYEQRHPSHLLETSDIDRIDPSLGPKLFTPDATIIILACATGREFAQQLSRQLGVTVICSYENTAVNGIRAFHGQNNSLKFQPQYRQPHYLRTYKNGQFIPPQTPPFVAPAEPASA